MFGIMFCITIAEFAGMELYGRSDRIPNDQEFVSVVSLATDQYS